MFRCHKSFHLSLSFLSKDKGHFLLFITIDIVLVCLCIKCYEQSLAAVKVQFFWPDLNKIRSCCFKDVLHIVTVQKSKSREAKNIILFSVMSNLIFNNLILCNYSNRNKVLNVCRLGVDVPIVPWSPSKGKAEISRRMIASDPIPSVTIYGVMRIIETQ